MFRVHNCGLVGRLMSSLNDLQNWSFSEESLVRLAVFPRVRPVPVKLAFFDLIQKFPAHNLF